MPLSSARVVLVPGLGLDGRSSVRVRDHLPAAVVPLPGMGLPGPVPPLEVLADRLLAGTGEGPVVLVGHSQSCQVVAVAARDARVVAVVLLGPTTDPRLRSPAGLVGRWLRTAWAEPWEQVPLVLRQWWRTGPRAMAALWRSAAPDPIDRRLRAVRVPVTVVRGTRDRLCPHDWAARVAAAAPQGALVELPGAAHMTPHTHPADVAAVIRDALPGTGPDGRAGALRSASGAGDDEQGGEGRGGEGRGGETRGSEGRGGEGALRRRHPRQPPGPHAC